MNESPRKLKTVQIDMQDFRILDMDLIFILFKEIRDKLENVQGARS